MKLTLDFHDAAEFERTRAALEKMINVQNMKLRAIPRQRRDKATRDQWMREETETRDALAALLCSLESTKRYGA